jgi:hypothetical protein
MKVDGELAGKVGRIVVEFDEQKLADPVQSE